MGGQKTSRFLPWFQKIQRFAAKSRYQVRARKDSDKAGKWFRNHSSGSTPIEPNIFANGRLHNGWWSSLFRTWGSEPSWFGPGTSQRSEPWLWTNSTGKTARWTSWWPARNWETSARTCRATAVTASSQTPGPQPRMRHSARVASIGWGITPPRNRAFTPSGIRRT